MDYTWSEEKPSREGYYFCCVDDNLGFVADEWEGIVLVKKDWTGENLVVYYYVSDDIVDLNDLCEGSTVVWAGPIEFPTSW